MDSGIFLTKSSPHSAVVGILGLVSGLDSAKVRLVTADDCLVELVRLGFILRPCVDRDGVLYSRTNLVPEAIPCGISLGDIRMDGVVCIDDAIDISPYILHRHAEHRTPGIKKTHKDFVHLLVIFGQFIVIHLGSILAKQTDNPLHGIADISNDGHICSLNIISLEQGVDILEEGIVAHRIDVIHHAGCEALEVLLDKGLVLIIISHSIDQR